MRPVYVFDYGRADVVQGEDGRYFVRENKERINGPMFLTIPHAVMWYHVSYQIQKGNGEAIIEQRA